MYQRMTHESQSNPLLPGYSFNAYLVAGLKPILADGSLDFFIDRPDGMKGYIMHALRCMVPKAVSSNMVLIRKKIV